MREVRWGQKRGDERRGGERGPEPPTSRCDDAPGVTGARPLYPPVRLQPLSGPHTHHIGARGGEEGHVAAVCGGVASFEASHTCWGEEEERREGEERRGE